VVHYDERGRERFRAAHGLTGKFVVMYSGNHSPCHPLDTVLEAARVMRDDTGVAFVFIGGGSEFQKVADSGLGNVVCLPYQPLEALAGSLSAADLHLVVMGEPFVGIVHPCKIYNVLAVGSPCLYIGPRPSHVTELPADSISCAGHGDVAGVIGIVRRSAALGARRLKAVDEFSAASIVPAMIAMIEDAGRVREEAVRVAEAVP
jgi:hypothetical protein